MSDGRYKTNPFIPDMIIPIKDKQVRLSVLGREQNVLVNQATGEIHGTHVTTYNRVDGEQFVKLFTANIALTFDWLFFPNSKVRKRCVDEDMQAFRNENIITTPPTTL